MFAGVFAVHSRPRPTRGTAAAGAKILPFPARPAPPPRPSFATHGAGSLTSGTRGRAGTSICRRFLGGYRRPGLACPLLLGGQAVIRAAADRGSREEPAAG